MQDIWTCSMRLLYFLCAIMLSGAKTVVRTIENIEDILTTRANDNQNHRRRMVVPALLAHDLLRLLQASRRMSGISGRFRDQGNLADSSGRSMLNMMAASMLAVEGMQCRATLMVKTIARMVSEMRQRIVRPPQYSNTFERERRGGAGGGRSPGFRHRPGCKLCGVFKEDCRPLIVGKNWRAYRVLYTEHKSRERIKYIYIYTHTHTWPGGNVLSVAISTARTIVSAEGRCPKITHRGISEVL